MAEKNFTRVFSVLRSILLTYAPGMEVNADSDVEYGLQTRWRRAKDGYPGYFASVRQGKRYVSFHLMPLYGFPEMVDEISPALRKRMQGKSCFNFTRVDVELFEELETLTQRGYETFRAHGLLEGSDG